MQHDDHDPRFASADGTANDPGIDADIERLAGLSPVEYDRVRKDETKQLGLRIGTLDDAVKAARKKCQDGGDLGLYEPDPWPEEVDGDDLLDRIAAAILHHVVMPTYLAQVVALWVVHTHCFENWQCTPRLSIGAPDMGCGKTTLLDVIGSLVPRPVRTENLTTAVMFRIVDKYRPTLLVDEVDTFLRENDELRGALNAGHRKGGQVFRCEGDDNQLKGFSTFAPVATAGIGKLPGTLVDRSIPIILHKRKADEPVQDFRADQTDHLRELARQVARWVSDHQIAVSNADPTMPPGIHNRLADNWRPLLAIADVAGEECAQRARDAAVRLTRTQSDETSYRVMALADIKAIFEKRKKDSLPSATICDELAEMEDRPWPEYRNSKPITPRQLANLLKPFGITPGTIRTKSGTPKGYTRVKFEDAFDRYLPAPPSQPATTPQATDSADFDVSQSATEGRVVADGACEKPTVSADCGVVADEAGGTASESLSDDEDSRSNEKQYDLEDAINDHNGEADLTEIPP